MLHNFFSTNSSQPNENNNNIRIDLFIIQFGELTSQWKCRVLIDYQSPSSSSSDSDSSSDSSAELTITKSHKKLRTSSIGTAPVPPSDDNRECHTFNVETKNNGKQTLLDEPSNPQESTSLKRNILPLLDFNDEAPICKDNPGLPSKSPRLPKYKRVQNKFFRTLLLPKDRTKENPLYFLVWDTTCHIMMDLTGDEHHNYFPKEVLERIAPYAFSKAEQQLGLGQKNYNYDQKVLLAGVAFWNLLLSKSDGGVYPDKLYDTFIKELEIKLREYWDNTKEITTEVMIAAFKAMKKFSIGYFNAEYSYTTENINNGKSEDQDFTPKDGRISLD